MEQEVVFKRCDWDDAPEIGGVYIIVYRKTGTPIFKGVGSGPREWKRKIVNAPIQKLQDKWVSFDKDEQRIVYIGKADGKGPASTLKRRVKTYGLFGSGQPVPHFGGRYIWQIGNKEDFFVFWKEAKNPLKEENRMLIEFKNQHDGRLPFANLRL